MTIKQRAKMEAEIHYGVGQNTCVNAAQREAYSAGVASILSRPLVQRLTDGELKRIRELYWGKCFAELDFIELISTRRVLEYIFGKEILAKD